MKYVVLIAVILTAIVVMRAIDVYGPNNRGDHREETHSGRGAKPQSDAQGE
jgi:hypothetical protein